MKFEKLNGLVPAVIQDFETFEVLMVGFMDEEALRITRETSKVTFFSRSKNRLWVKGETSGNFLEVKKIVEDCDNDSLLILVKASGPTCHSGGNSCFGIKRFSLQNLYQLIEKRKIEMPDDSYTVSLFKGGVEKILAKVEEEALEVLQAARFEGKKRLIEESCDLLYHLFVLLNNEDVKMEDLNAELRKRLKDT